MRNTSQDKGDDYMAKKEQAIGKSTGKNKTKMKVYNSREARQVVRRNGYEYSYSRGDHDYYMKNNRRIVIARNLNRMIWERLVKEYELDLSL